MKIKTRKGFNLQPVLDSLSKALENGDLSTGFLKFFNNSYTVYLRTALEGEGLTEAFLSQVIIKAISQTSDFTASDFLGHCNRIANEMHKERHRKFKVVFPLRGAQNLITEKRKWDNIWIDFDIVKSSKFARKAIAARTAQLKRRGDNLLPAMERTDELPWAVCSVQSINIADAFERAENAISKELGLHSLVTPRSKRIFSNSLLEPPINTILLAPYMTVHDPSGTISADMLWYNRWDSFMSPPNRTQDDIKEIRHSVEFLREKIRELPWREEAEQVLIRYYKAFSHFNLETTFLDGWKLLEFIGGEKNTKSDKLIKRVAFLTSNPEYSKEIGRHLAERRNLISHGKSIDDDKNEVLAWEMKSFVGPLLETFLTNPFNFKNKKELWEFCDLPVDKENRDKQAKLLASAKKFRH